MAATERMLTGEQIRVLMDVVGSEDPMAAALEIRGRWRYILGLALAAQRGLGNLDTSLPQVALECDDYARRARAVVAVLDEQLAEWEARRP